MATSLSLVDKSAAPNRGRNMDYVLDSRAGRNPENSKQYGFERIDSQARVSRTTQKLSESVLVQLLKKKSNENIVKEQVSHWKICSGTQLFHSVTTTQALTETTASDGVSHCVHMFICNKNLKTNSENLGKAWSSNTKCTGSFYAFEKTSCLSLCVRWSTSSPTQTHMVSCSSRAPFEETAAHGERASAPGKRWRSYSHEHHIYTSATCTYKLIKSTF